MEGVIVTVAGFFYSLFSQIGAAILNIQIFDVLDISIVAFIVYKAIDLFKETRAKQLVKGIFLLFFLWVLAQWLDLISVKWLLVKVVDYAIIAVAVIFQPELRRALEKMGRSNISSFTFGQSGLTASREIILTTIDAVCKSAGTMQSQKVGALMVFERDTQLGEVINTGTFMDALATPSMICNVFYPKSPLHDGAMIIRAGRLCAAGCILPLTSNSEIGRELGTRHRAAIGVSENSDAIVVVVSEETGNISITHNGIITRNYNPITLRDELNKYLLENIDEKPSKNIFKRIKNRRN